MVHIDSYGNSLIVSELKSVERCRDLSSLLDTTISILNGMSFTLVSSYMDESSPNITHANTRLTNRVVELFIHPDDPLSTVRRVVGHELIHVHDYSVDDSIIPQRLTRDDTDQEKLLSTVFRSKEIDSWAFTIAHSLLTSGISLGRYQKVVGQLDRLDCSSDILDVIKSCTGLIDRFDDDVYNYLKLSMIVIYQYRNDKSPITIARHACMTLVNRRVPTIYRLVSKYM